MTDESKKPSIPAWQTQTPEDASNTLPKSSTPIEARSPKQDGGALIEQAKVFLEDASVRETSREKKIAFLEKKGLSNDTIQELLATPPSEPASSVVEESSLNTIHDSSKTSSNPDSSATLSSSPSNTPSQPNHDRPPIITYPEFLLRPSKPPPLITLQRLTYALYTLAGISALTYGASKHLIQPMLESLTSARHDLSTTTLHNLEKLNEKLEGTVSRIPPHTSNSMLLKLRKRDDNDEDTSDVETVDSDPTELFHRDMGVQTSPTLLTRSSSFSPSSSFSSPTNHHNQDQEQEKDSSTTTTTTRQSDRLNSLKTSLSSLLPHTESASQTEDTTAPETSPLSTAINSLDTYLCALQLNTKSSSYDDYDFFSSTTNANKTKGSSNSTKATGGDREDSITRFRQEIRSLKGALLSVRNFPSVPPPPPPAGARGRAAAAR